MARRPVVTLLTDFGLRDVSAAICRSVVLDICPDAEVIDLSHEIRKYAIRDGALALWCALPYAPLGFHVAVVDPGVGTARRPIALRVARGDVLIGPDNGLLVPAAERLGGVVEARLLENPAYRLPLVTSTFHGRDVFAPAAAHLARGASFESLGSAIADELVASPIPAAHGRRRRPGDRGDLRGHVRQPQAVRAGRRRPRGDGRRSGRGARSRSRPTRGRVIPMPWARTFGRRRGRRAAAVRGLVRAGVHRGQPGIGGRRARARDGNRLQLRRR